MKKLILAVMFALLTILSVNANTTNETTTNETTVTNHYYKTELNDTINKIHISVPCRVMYSSDIEKLDTTYLIVSDASKSFKIYHEVKDNVLYIKSNLSKENLTLLQSDKGTPIIRIMMKQNTQPEITTGSRFTKSRKQYGNATETFKN